MKKIFVILMISISSFVFSQEYTIDTSRGEQTVTIPEGMNVEEAFLAMAKLYIEERYDLEDTLEQIKEITKTSEDYLKASNQYKEDVDRLTEDYEQLLNLYEQALNRKSISVTPFIFNYGFGGFVEFYNVTLGASMGVPLNFNFYLGYRIEL